MKTILCRPLITEKNTYHQAVNTYVFECAVDATKPEIQNTVEKLFKVKVDSVRTIQCRGRGKKTKFGVGQAPRWKKALVKLKDGEKIAIFEGV